MTAAKKLAQSVNEDVLGVGALAHDAAAFGKVRPERRCMSWQPLWEHALEHALSSLARWEPRVWTGVTVVGAVMQCRHTAIHGSVSCMHARTHP